MIKNYFKTAWRVLWNNKFYSAINIAGLAVGLAVGIMILLWVKHESGYDGFYRNASTITIGLTIYGTFSPFCYTVQNYSQRMLVLVDG